MTLKNVGSNCDSIRAANLGVFVGRLGRRLQQRAAKPNGISLNQCAHELKAGAGGWRIAFGRLRPPDKSSTTKAGKGGRAWLTDIPADATATLVPDLRHLAPRRCLRLF